MECLVSSLVFTRLRPESPAWWSENNLSSSTNLQGLHYRQERQDREERRDRKLRGTDFLMMYSKPFSSSKGSHPKILMHQLSRS